MSDLLIRNLDKDTIARLRARARREGRSLQSEARMILERAAGPGPEEIAAIFDRWRKRLAQRKRSSRTLDLIREDRSR